MKTQEIMLRLEYFQKSTELKKNLSYAAGHKYEGIKQKICKGKELTRDELIWLKFEKIWSTLQDRLVLNDDGKRPREWENEYSEDYKSKWLLELDSEITRNKEIMLKYAAIEDTWLKILEEDDTI